MGLAAPGADGVAPDSAGWMLCETDAKGLTPAYGKSTNTRY
jgi:hypothetical protein